MIEVTPKAALKIRQMLADANRPEGSLRLGVVGGAANLSSSNHDDAERQLRACAQCWSFLTSPVDLCGWAAAA